MIGRLLGAYVGDDDRERAFVQQMLELRLKTGSSRRDHFDPGHFTASAFILSPDDQAVLLIEHSKLHRWLQPGGHIDPTDIDLESAARREVAEETGITRMALVAAPFDVDVHAIPARRDEPEHLHFDVRFLFRAASLEMAAGSDALAARWVPRVEVPTVKTDDSVWRAMRKLDRMLG